MPTKQSAIIIWLPRYVSYEKYDVLAKLDVVSLAVASYAMNLHSYLYIRFILLHSEN